MNKKSKLSALASATLMSLVLTTALSAGSVKAAAGSVTRTSGADRYATAAQVATSNWTTSDNVVLVSGDGYADAVSASALAKKLNAPILLTTAKSLVTDTSSALSTLKAKNIYVVGGNASVSQAVRDQLKANYTLIELGGANRYETNAAVAQKLVELGVDPANTMMVGGEGFSDALSVAPIAAAKGQILLLGMNDANYMKPVLDFVKKNNSKVTVVGTSYVINDSIYSTVNAVARVNGGQDRFDTNLKVLAAFKDTVKTDKLYVANASGNGYADALVASALAGKTAAPLVLVDSEASEATSNAIEYIKANITAASDLQAVGGIGVVPESLIGKINAVVPADNNQNTTAAVDLKTLTFDTTTLPFTTIATFKLSVPTGDSASNYTVTVKGKTAQYNSTTGLFGASFDDTLTAANFAASDFVVKKTGNTTTTMPKATVAKFNNTALPFTTIVAVSLDTTTPENYNVKVNGSAATLTTSEGKKVFSAILNNTYNENELKIEVSAK